MNPTWDRVRPVAVVTENVADDACRVAGTAHHVTVDLLLVEPPVQTARHTVHRTP